MAKAALLVGVSEYGAGLNSLPKAVDDIEAMKLVLQQPGLGDFSEVKVLPNPDTLMMQIEIEHLFAERTRDDLILFFFSGHGVKDDRGNLYFATSITRKTAEGELIKATAVPAVFVHDIMSNSRSRRQVVILDCCFSGAFAKGLAAKDDGSVNLKEQLGGEGRVVLTSSASTQYSFEDSAADLSVYTRYLVEGIRSGAADNDSDGMISVEELHEYAKRKVHEAAPAMKPKIYAVEEGFRILLSKSPKGDPALVYRQEVERCASQGSISAIGRRILDELRDTLELSESVTQAIEAEVCKPHQEYTAKLHAYEQALASAAQQESPLSDYTWKELHRYQQVLGLRHQDVAPIQATVLPPAPGSAPLAHGHQSPATAPATTAAIEAELSVPPALTTVVPTTKGTARHRSVQVPKQTQSKPGSPWVWAGVGLGVAGLAGWVGFAMVRYLADRPPNDLVPITPGETLPEPVETLSIEEIQANQQLKNRRQALRIDASFFNQLVNHSFYAKYPGWQGRTLSDRASDQMGRERWRAIAHDWLDTLETHLSAEARAGLDHYTQGDIRDRTRDVETRYHLSNRALNDMTDAKFLALFPDYDPAVMNDADRFIRIPMGQIWHGIATDEMQQIKTGASLKTLSLDTTRAVTTTGQLAPGEGMAYIMQLSRGQRLTVEIEVPADAVRLSVYPSNLKTASPIVEDSARTHVSATLTQTGFHEVVLVSVNQRAAQYTLTVTVD